MAVSNIKSAILGIDIGGASVNATPVDSATGKLLTKTTHRAAAKAATAEAMLSRIGQIKFISINLIPLKE